MGRGETLRQTIPLPLDFVEIGGRGKGEVTYATFPFVQRLIFPRQGREGGGPAEQPPVLAESFFTGSTYTVLALGLITCIPLKM